MANAMLMAALVIFVYVNLVHLLALLKKDNGLMDAAWGTGIILVALWAAFGTTLRTSLSSLAGRYGLASLLGAVAGPLSYLGGAKLGAVTIHPNRAFSIAALAVGSNSHYDGFTCADDTEVVPPVSENSVFWRVGLRPDRAPGHNANGCAVGWAVVMPLLVWLAHGGRFRNRTPNGAGMTRRPIACMLIIGALVSAGKLGAAELPAPLRDVKPELRPIGTATLHWFGLHVYDAALFAEEASFATNATAALSIRYNISIKRQRLLDTTLKEWRRLGTGAAVEREQWIKQLESLLPDLKQGDRLTAFRHGGGPTQFFFGDRLLGEVSDPAFGPAFFAIWLDEDCRYPDVREGLLGVRKRAQKER